MFRRRRFLRRTSAGLLAVLLAGAMPAAAQEAGGNAALGGEGRPSLALMGTIPIYWGESEGDSRVGGGFGALLRGNHRPHWARAILERDFSLWPLAYLSAEALAPQARLLMAQPRGLSPEENVALDSWVRGGGRLLLLADPMMTGHSHYRPGDRRRPQDVTLLSPILAHWGMALQFDASQPAGLQMREIRGRAVPVDLPGRLVANDDSASCTIFAEGLAAHCRLGSGYALILADAALLDHAGPWPGAACGLAALATQIFGDVRGSATAGPSGSADNSPESAEACAVDRPARNGEADVPL